MKALQLTQMLAAAALMTAPVSALAASRVTVHAPSANNVLQIGGGVNDFRTGLDSATDPGSAWDLRLIIGARQPIGLEAAYFGSMNDLNGTTAPGVPGSTSGNPGLMVNSGEALLRANLGGVNGDIQPYVAAGAGVANLSVVNKDDLSAADSDVRSQFNNSTDVTIPAAAGIDAFLGKSMTLGARVGYRYFFRDQVRADARSADAQQWNATARLGVAF
jgi:hypothetical protein